MDVIAFHGLLLPDSIFARYSKGTTMRLIKISVISVSIVLAGCVSAPNSSEINSANYGVLPNNYQDVIKSEMGKRLKDPNSAEYDFSQPYKAWCKSGFTTFYGWLAPFSLNAKNSYGGYTGAQTFVYLINDKSVRDFTSPYQVGGCGKV